MNWKLPLEQFTLPELLTALDGFLMTLKEPGNVASSRTADNRR
jgi:hypothetical protein